MPPPTSTHDVATIPQTLQIGCRFEFEQLVDTHAVVLVEPHESERGRVIRERFVAPPSTPTTWYRDHFGNRCRRLTLPAGSSEFSYEAIVRNDQGFDAVDLGAEQHPAADLPDETLTYLLPSRYCPSDQLADRAVQLFAGLAPGWAKAEEIAGWVHNHVTFAYGSSSPDKTAADVLDDGVGVCRDFAHLLITFSRALNIPARYVTGYLPDIAVPDPGTPMDFCAWTELFLGDRWYTFDPRNHGQRRVGRTVVARGRDAADVAMTTTFGRTRLLTMTVDAKGSG